jgi:hypothetical protein
VNDEEDDPPEFYWWSRLIYGLMANLHISEREVLAMRWDRATAYLDEILIDLGKSVSRPLPEFNDEFEAVKRAMRDEYYKKHGVE